MDARRDAETTERDSARFQRAMERIAEDQARDLERAVARVLDVLLLRLDQDAEDALLEEVARELLEEDD